MKGWVLSGWMGIGALWAFGMTHNLTFPPYKIAHWGLEQGLPQVTISAIQQTRDGYLWVGTQKGLARFDGFQFKVFESETEPLLKSDSIGHLAEGPDGRLWIGTQRGLVLYHQGRFLPIDGGQAFENSPIQALTVTHDGEVLVAVESGIYVLRGEVWQELSRESDGLPEVRELLSDSDGRVWMGTEVGLRLLENGHVRRLQGDEAIDGHPVRKLYLDDDGALWMAGPGFGLARFDSGELSVLPFPDGRETEVLSIGEDGVGDLWLGTMTKGLVRIEEAQRLSAADRETWIHGEVRTLHRDSEGNFWVGTRTGLKCMRPRVYNRIDHRQGFANEMVWSVYEDPQGVLWAATGGSGAVRFDRGSIKSFNESEGLSSNMATAVMGDGKGAVWVGTRQGLSLIRKDRVVRFSVEDGLPGSYIRALLVDGRGWVWVGTRKGLALYRDGRFEIVEDFPVSGRKAIRTIVEDQKGNVWIGTGNGVFRWDGQGAAAFAEVRGLEGLSCPAIYADAAGDVWIGTYDHGLFRFRNGRIKAITKKEGLFADIIFAILEDDRGNLWMSTYRGFFKAGKTQIHQVMANQRERVNCQAFGSHREEAFGECSGGVSPAAWRGRNGLLIFPSSKGILIVDPTKAMEKPVLPKVIVESLLVDGRPVDLRDGVHLDSESRQIEVHFTGVTFEDAEKLKFEVKLEPHETAWQEIGARRTASYVNLPPGHYRFMVRAANADGYWVEGPTRFNFYMVPKFYETDFFLLVCIVVAGLLLAGGHQLRLRKSESRRLLLEKLVQARTQALEASNRELQNVHERLVRAAHYAGKAEIATDVLHSVGNALNSVVVSTSLIQDRTKRLKVNLYEKLVPLFEEYQGQIDAFLTNDPRGKRVLPNMGKMGRALKKYRDQMLDEIAGLQKMVHHIMRIIRDQQRYADMGMHFEVVDLDEIVSEAIELQSGLLQSAEVELHSEIATDIQIRIPKIAFLQVLANLIKNACEASVKAKAGQRHVHLTAWLKDPGWVHLEISDSGAGIEERDLTRIFRQGYTTKPGANGFGLHFCGNVISELKGQISVRSDGAGRGATFLLELPVVQHSEPGTGI